MNNSGKIANKCIQKKSKRCDFSAIFLQIPSLSNRDYWLNTTDAIITISGNNGNRLVIPEFIRKKLHITKEVPLLITELDDDKIVIKKLDRDEIEKRLRDELKDLDIDKIASEVRTEVNEKARKKYAAILD